LLKKNSRRRNDTKNLKRGKKKRPRCAQARRSKCPIEKGGQVFGKNRLSPKGEMLASERKKFGKKGARLPRKVQKPYRKKRVGSRRRGRLRDGGTMNDGHAPEPGVDGGVPSGRSSGQRKGVANKKSLGMTPFLLFGERCG